MPGGPAGPDPRKRNRSPSGQKGVGLNALPPGKAVPEGPPLTNATTAKPRPLWRRLLGNGVLLGLLAFGAVLLLNREDLPGIGAVLLDLPAALAISAAVHLLQIIATGLAWCALFPLGMRPPRGSMVLLRWYRESANALLPAGALVGQAAAAQLLARRGVRGDIAGATATVDLTVEAVSQFAFTLLGFALLLADGEAGNMAGIAIAGIGLAALGVLGMIGAQRHLPLRWLETAMTWLSRRWPRLQPTWIGSFQSAVLRLHADRRAMAAAMAWHLLAWALGAVEIMAVLALLGHHVSFADALIIESLAQALRNAGFMLPGALGVQEGAIIGAAALVGVPAIPALAAALVRRTREVLFGLPGLLAWRRSHKRVGAAVAVPAGG